jgi:hypothetical protein
MMIRIDSSFEGKNLSMQPPIIRVIDHLNTSQRCFQYGVFLQVFNLDIIKGGAHREYASEKTKPHLLRLIRLKEQIEKGTIDNQWLSAIEG